MKFWQCGKKERRRKNEPDKAIKDLNEAIRLKPNFINALNNRGILNVQKENYDEAIAESGAL